MAGDEETKVETPATPAGETIEKKDLVEADEEKKEEKKDEEKEEKKEKSAEKKEKKKKEVLPVVTVHKKDFEKDVVYLYQFNRCPQIPSTSPYCLKTETWLKFYNIKYENVDHKCKHRSKRGMLPFVELNGEEIADSDIIIKTLSKKFEKDMDEGLTTEQKNVQHAMITMVDNHLIGIVDQWKTRHVDNVLKGYNLNLQHMMGNKMPNALLAFAFKHTMLRKIARKVKATGLSGYSNEELDDLGKQDMKVLSDLLGEKQFFFGDEPHNLDLNVFAVMAQLTCLNKDVSNSLRDYLESDCTNLVGLYNRMKDRAWGDHWDEAIGEKLELNPHIPKPEPPAPKEEEKKEEEKEKADEKKEEKEKDKEEKDKDENKEENKDSK